MDMRLTALAVVFLLTALAFSGCTAIGTNCHEEPTYQTVNADHCDATTGCSCLSHTVIGGVCTSCQCQVGTHKVCPG